MGLGAPTGPARGLPYFLKHLVIPFVQFSVVKFLAKFVVACFVKSLAGSLANSFVDYNIFYDFVREIFCGFSCELFCELLEYSFVNLSEFLCGLL